MNNKRFVRGAGISRPLKLKLILFFTCLLVVCACGLFASAKIGGLFSYARAEEAVNLIPNGNLETMGENGSIAGFQLYVEKGMTPDESDFTLSYGAFGRNNGRGVKIEKRNAESRGQAVLLSDFVNRDPEKTYIFSYYVKTENMQGDFSVFSMQHENSRWEYNNENYTQNGDWTVISTKVHGKGSESLAFYIFASTVNDKPGMGTVYIDDVSLTEYTPDPTNLIYNPGFSEVSANRAADWSFWVALNDQSEALADVDFGIETGENSLDGSSFRIRNRSGNQMIRGVLNSNIFAMEPGATYMFSYYYRSTASSAVTAVMLRQYKDNGANPAPTANNTYYWEDSATVRGVTAGWKKVTTVFTVEPDANYGMIQMDITPTGENAVYFDDFRFEKIEIGEVNKGFERTDGAGKLPEWLLSEEESFEFSDEIFYDGASSAHIKREDYLSAFTAKSIGVFEVVPAKTYSIGYRMRSQNSPNVKATITINIYNEQQQMMDTIVSPYVFLKSDEGLSDWTDVWMRFVMPAAAVRVRFTVTISAGVADCYIDGLYCRESGNIVLSEDFESVGDDGLCYGYNGKAENFTEGKLVLNAKEEVSAEFDGALYAYGYTFTGDMVTEGNAKPVIVMDWYSYNHNKLSSASYPLKTDGASFSLEFVAPTGTYAVIAYKNEGEGSVTFDNLIIEKTYDPALAATGWEGMWICYPYTDVAYGGASLTTYYRHKFEATEPITYARIQFTGDDITTAYINGTEIEDENKEAWANTCVKVVTDLLNEGENILAFKVENQTYYTGLLFDMEIIFESGKTMRVYSDKDVLTGKLYEKCRKDGANYYEGGEMKEGDDWTAFDYDDSKWQNSYVVGPVSTQPWGTEIVYKRNTDVMPNAEITAFEIDKTVNAGEELTFTATFKTQKIIEEDIPFKVFFRGKYVADEAEVIGAWLTPTLVSGKKSSEWAVGEENALTFKVIVPDYITSGSYALQISQDEIYITNEQYFNNVIRGHYVRIATKDVSYTESKVVKENDVVRLVINGEKVVPMMYLREQTTVFKTRYAEGMAGAGVDLMCLPNCRSYNMNNDGSMWTAEDVYDFSALDGVVYETLEGAPNAKLMLMLDADPPTWWLNSHRDSRISYKENNATKYGVSYASEEWREAVNKYFTALLEYAMQSPWAGHIFSVKISAGATFEWQYYGQTLSQCADMSAAGLNSFRKWLRAKYGTDEALRKAWGKSGVTIDTVTVPTFEDRKPTTYETLLSGKAQRNVIDFHLFMSDMTTDSILSFAETVKSVTENRWIVGTYNGYLSVALTYESAGLSNASISKILESPYIDFLCSPICYDERLIGMSASYMMMVDTVIAAGKLPIIECDSRTVYFNSRSFSPSLLAEWGKTYTLKDSIESLKRDFSNMMTKGAGLWWYDMNGGWFDDPEIYSLISVMYKEWEYALNQPSKSLSRIAYVVEDDLVTTMTYSFDGSYDYLYQVLYSQKESLAHIGASFDMLFTSGLMAGTARDYDVYLIVAANLDKEEIAAINKYVKKKGKTVIWVGFPGIYGEDGEMTAANVSAVTGIDLAFAKGAAYGVTVKEGDALTAGLDGLVYGKPLSTQVDPMLCVNDWDAVPLGNIYGTDLVGLAYKKIALAGGGTYTSIYSSAGNIPAKFLRNVLKGYGAELLENDGDVVYGNESYISVATPYGGMKTIKLGRTTDVYDVFSGKLLAKDVSEITVETRAGEAILLRLGTYTEPTPDPEPDVPDPEPEKKNDTLAIVLGTTGGAATVSAAAIIAIIIKKRKTIK